MIEETLVRIAVALEAMVAAAPTASTPAPAEKPKATKKKAAAKKVVEPALTPEPIAPAEPVMTIEALNAALVGLAAKMGPTGVTEIMGLLKHYDVLNVTSLPEDKRAEMLKRAEEVVANAG